MLWGASGLRGTGSWGTRVARVARVTRVARVRVARMVRVARVTRVKDLGWLLARGLRMKWFFDFLTRLSPEIILRDLD